MSVISLKTRQKYSSLLAGNAYYVPPAFESIASATGTGSSNTITFSNIPGTYQHLHIRGLMKNTNTGSGMFSIRITVNGTGGTSYARHLIYGDGSALGASGSASGPYIDSYGGNVSSNAAYTNTCGAIILDIHDYASTTKNKTFRMLIGAERNATASTMELTSGLFNSTSAITSIELVSSTTNWTSQTQFALYGIKGA